MSLVVILLFSLGFFFVFAGIVGILRLPDFYSRLHAQGKSDTLGVALMLGALALHHGWTMDSAKILLIVLFIGFANPTLTHALARAARKSGLKVWEKKETQ
jgi:multicomponent Na+:H+ antiporter subunit G